MLGFGTVPGMILFGHAAAIVAGRGGSTALVATCVSWMALTNMVGRLVGGAVIDRLSSRAALGGIPLFSIVGMLGLIATDSPAAAVAMLLATMTHFGLLTTTMPVALTRQVGPHLFAKAYGTIFFFWFVHARRRREGPRTDRKTGAWRAWSRRGRPGCSTI